MKCLGLQKRFYKSVYLLLLMMFLGACNSSSDDGEVEEVDGDEPTANLVISQIQANTLAVYQNGDSLRVDYQLEVSELDSPDVSIDFYLVHNADIEHGAEIDDVHFLTNVELLAVENGSTVGTFTVDIPIVAESGDFWIHSILDPDNMVEEDNETDNYPNEESGMFTEEQSPTVAIYIDAPPNHEFVFVDTTINDGVVMLDSPELHDIMSDHHADILGHIDAIYHGDSEVHASLTAQVLINDVYQDVEIWDSTTETYQDHLELDFTFDGDEHDFGYDVRLSHEQIAALYEGYDAESENEVHLLFTLNNMDENNDEHDDSNNHVEVVAQLYFFEGTDSEEQEVEALGQSRDRTSSASSSKSAATWDVVSLLTKAFGINPDEIPLTGAYNLSWGSDSSIKLELGVSGKLVANPVDYYSKIVAGGSLDLTVFDDTTEIIGADFLGQAYLTGDDTGYEAELDVFGQAVYERSSWASDHFSKTFEKSWEEDKQLARATFTLGIVPVTVKAGLEGSIGFELTLAYDNINSEIVASGNVLEIDFSGWATGGVDVVVASAGVGVNITILNNTLALESSASMANLLADDPTLDVSLEVTDTLTALDGFMYVYVSYEQVKFCNYVVVTLPCGTETKDYTKFLFSWAAYRKTWDLFNESYTFDL